MMTTFLPIVARCDNFSFFDHQDELSLFCVSGADTALKAPVGLLWPEVVAALRDDNEVALSEGRAAPWTFTDSAGRTTHVHFSESYSDRTSRSVALEATCTRWHKTGVFAEVIGGRQWRNESYVAYANPLKFGGREPGDIVFTIERAAAALFGLVTYGVHMTAFQKPKSGTEGEIKTWVPTRARTKPTWPGYLDNTVAGGIPVVDGAVMSPFDSLVKEAMEEASLPEDIVKKHTRSVTAITYFHQKGRYLQPEVEFVYDLEIPNDGSLSDEELQSFCPKPLDGEVETFELLPMSEVISRMHAGSFKPNCALVLLDFLIRYGLVTPENEPNFLEIVARMHGQFEYSSWGRK